MPIRISDFNMTLLSLSPDLVERQPSCTAFQMKGGCISKLNLRIHYSTCVSNYLKLCLGFLRETWGLPLPPSVNCTSLAIMLTNWLQCFLSYWLETSSQISKSKCEARFSRLFADFALIDTWRHLYPTCKAVSCSSTPYSTMSHINLILLSQRLTPRLQEAGFCASVLSDHAPYWMTWTLFTKPPCPNWRLNPFWLNILPQY